LQIRFERERAKRLAYKIEELKQRNKSLKQQLESGRFNATKNESNNTETILIIRTLFEKLFGQSVPDNIDINGFQAQCQSLVQEIYYLRGISNRLMIWFIAFNHRRADLRFQKVYLSLQVDDLLTSNKQTLTFIHGMGVDLDEEEKEPLRAIVKVKRGINVIIAIHRMKLLAANWRDIIDGFVDQ
jgi:hypothetical protein